MLTKTIVLLVLIRIFHSSKDAHQDLIMYKYFWQICENGILKFRPRSKVAPGYPKAGRGEILFCLPLLYCYSGKYSTQG